MGERDAGARFEALRRSVEEGMARYGVPGVAQAAIDGDDERAAGMGVTSVEHPLPVDGDTLFQLASITKTATATAVLRLVEMGKLGLDEPVRRWVPELRLPGDSLERLTLRHLLSHTGGFAGDVVEGRYGPPCGSGDDALARLMGLLERARCYAPPGELWAYCNAGFSIAGRAVEVVTGQTYERALRELVLEPLGMERACFFAHEAITHRVAIGHEVRDGRAVVQRDWAIPRALNPAGGLICSARELLRYARFQLGDGTIPGGGERLLSAESMAALREPLAGDALHNGCLASFADRVGLGWFSRETRRGRLLTHGGWTSLALRLTLVPGLRFGVGVLTNADVGAQLHAEVTKRALREWAGIDVPDEAPRGMPAPALEEYAGVYEVEGLEEVAVRVSGDGLEIERAGRALFYAPDRVVAQDGVWRGERGQFLRDERGAVWALRFAGRVGERVTPGAVS